MNKTLCESTVVVLVPKCNFFLVLVLYTFSGLRDFLWQNLRLRGRVPKIEEEE
jgi:hypothetical protein